MDQSNKIQEVQSPNWDRLSRLFSVTISSSSIQLKLKSIISFTKLSKQAPDSIIAPQIPILINLLNSTDNSIIQESIAHALLSLSRKPNCSLAQIIVQSGAIPIILRLLLISRNGFRRCLLKCLNHMVMFSDSNRVSLAINGGLQVILELIVLSSDDTRKYLLMILTSLSLLREVRRDIVNNNGLRFLTEALLRGNMLSRTRAAHAIGLIGISKGTRHALVELGAIESLIRLLREGDNSSRIVAGNALGIVSSHVDHMKLVGQHGAIPLYMEMLKGESTTGREIVEDVFCVLAVAHENAEKIMDELVTLLKGIEEDEDVKAIAINIVWDLANYEHSVCVLRNSGVIQVLIELLRNGSMNIKEKALATIAQLSYEKKNKGVMVAEGLLPLLFELLRNGDAELKEYAAECVINFLEDPLYCDLVSQVYEIPSFYTLRERLHRIRSSNDDMTSSMRILSIEQLTSDFPSF